MNESWLINIQYFGSVKNTIKLYIYHFVSNPLLNSVTKIIRAPCYHKFYFDFPSLLLAYSPLASSVRLPLTLDISIVVAANTANTLFTHAIFPDVLHSGAGKPRTLGKAAEDTIQAPDDGLSRLRSSRSSPTTAFTPLHETERDAVIVGDSIVLHVRAMLAGSKVHTRVFDVSAQIPTILKGEESVGSVMLHKGWTTPSCGRQRHWRGTSTSNMDTIFSNTL